MSIGSLSAAAVYRGSNVSRVGACVNAGASARTAYTKIVSVLAVLLLVAVCSFMIYSHNENGSSPAQENDVDPQTLLLDEIDSKKGLYDETSIVLYNTAASKAKEIADKVGGIARCSDDGRFATVSLPDGMTVRDVVLDESNREYYPSLSLDYKISVNAIREGQRSPSAPAVVPSDTAYQKQGYFNYLNLGSLWETNKGSGTTIAIIDTGIDTDHPEFSGKISDYSYNASTDKVVRLNNNDWSIIEDEQGHGTSVAGIISASWDDQGIAGIAPEAELLIIKANCDQYGNFQRGSDLVFGLYYAIERGVSVINMSFGTSYDIFSSAVNLAVDNDIICVGSAGNNGTSALNYPAACVGCIGVGALGEDTWDIAPYSNYGENTTVMAPGTTYTTAVGGGYGYATGTSMSAPIVSAVISMFLSQNGYATFDEVLEIIAASSYDLGNLGRDSRYGFGALDASALISEPRGKITFNMLADELSDTSVTFIRDHTLQEMPEPERLYYVFDGWYYDDQFQGRVDYYETVFTESITLYAKWISEDDGIPFDYVQIDENSVSVTGYKGNRSVITVPKTIEGKQVVSIGSEAFMDNSKLVIVNLPEGIVTISERAFASCTSLRSITIPGTVMTIGDNAFEGCYRLSDLKITDSHLVSLGEYAFGGCASLTSFTIPDTLTTMNGSAFFGCTGMTSFTVGAGNDHFCSADGVLLNKAATSIVAFPAGHGPDYDIPDGITTIGKCAFGFSAIRTVDLTGVTAIGYSAFSCSTLEQISIPDSVTELGSSAFEYCYNLGTVSIGDNVQSIPDSCFRFDLSLSAITIPDGVTAISSNAFANTGLGAIEFGVGSALGSIGDYAFMLAPLDSIAVPDSVTEIGNGAFSYTELSSITFGQYSGLEIIGDECFRKTRELTSITFPVSLQSIGDYAFFQSSLEGTLVIPANVSTIGVSAFAECHGITGFYADPSNDDFDSADGVIFTEGGSTLVSFPCGFAGNSYDVPAGTTVISGGAFYGAHISSIVLPDGLTTIGSYAFTSSRIAGLQLPSSVISISPYAFSKSSIQNITFSPGSSLSTIGQYAFSESPIDSITIPSSVSSISMYAFKDCTSLTTVHFEDNSMMQSVAAYTFYGCKNLSEIDFGDNSSIGTIQAHALQSMPGLRTIDLRGTSLTDVGNYSFMHCRSLESVLLPDTVSSIGRFAFYGCTSLDEIMVPSSVDHIGRCAFMTTREPLIYMAADSLPPNLEQFWDWGVGNVYLGITGSATSGDWTYGTTSAGKVVILKYSGNDENIDLNSLTFGEIISIGYRAFSYSGIKSITLPSSLITIQSEAFYSCSLETIVIPSNVTDIGRDAFTYASIGSVDLSGASSLRKIEAGAFSYTPQLSSFTLPASVEVLGDGVFSYSGITGFTFADGSSLTTIPASAFRGSRIGSIAIPDSVSLIEDRAFQDTEPLKTVTFGSANPLRAEAYSFYNAGLESLSIPEGMTYIGEMAFSNLSSLAAFNVDGDNPNYSSVGGVLYSKDGSRLISVPGGLTGSFTVPESVSIISAGAFENSGLTSVTLNSKIAAVGYRTFFNADNLTEITIPSNVVSIDYYAFAYCDNLRTVVFENGTSLSGVYEGAFYGCNRLSDITLPSMVMEVSDFCFYGCRSISSLPFASGSEVVIIGDYAFGYTSIEELTVPVSVMVIGDYAFEGSQLRTVTIPDDNESNLTIGIGAFQDCVCLESMTLPFVGSDYYGEYYWFGYIFGSGHYESNGFYVPDSLKDVEFSGSFQKIGFFAFSECSSLENVTFPDRAFQLDRGMVFYHCNVRTNLIWDMNGGGAPVSSTYYEGINTIILPEGFEGFDAGFAFNSDLETLILNKDFRVFDETAYINLPNLKNLVVPDENPYFSVQDGILYDKAKTKVIRAFGYSKELTIPGTIISIPDGFIQGNKVVVDVVIEEGITTIGSRAFASTDIRSITLPSSLTSYEVDSFYETYRLTYVRNNSNLDFPSPYDGFTEEGERVVETDGTVRYVMSDGREIIITPDGFRFTKEGDAYLLREYLGEDEEITIPSDVMGHDYALFEFTGPKKVILPDGWTVINENSFSMDVKELIIPASVRTIEANTMRFMDGKVFICHEGLETLHSTPWGVEDIYLSSTVRDFEIASSYVKRVTVNPDNPYYESIDGIIYTEDYSRILFVPSDLKNSIVLPEGLKELPPDAFRGSEVSSITLPQSLEKICGFTLCPNLKSIVIPDKVSSFVSSLEGTPLEYLHLGKAVESLDLSFCSSLKTIDIDPENPYLKMVDGIIYSADGKRTIYALPSLSGDITIPDGTENIAGFRDVKNNYSIILPESVKVIDREAFAGSYLVSIKFPSHLETIGYNSFSGCHLTSIEVPEGVERLEMYTFYGPYLNEITLPSTIKTIDYDAFSNCTNLRVIHNNSDIQLTFGSTDNGSVAKYANRIIEKDDTVRDYGGIGDVEIVKVNGFTFYNSNGSYVMMGAPDDDIIELPESVNGNSYSIYRYLGLDTVRIPADNSKIELNGTIDNLIVPASVTHLVLSADVKNIHYEGTIAKWADTDVVFSTVVVSHLYDGYNLFIDDEIVEDIRLEKTVIGHGFNGCLSLRSVEIGEGATTIGEGAFRYCHNLAHIIIPSSVDTIYRYAFDDTAFMNDEDNWNDGSIHIGTWLIKVKDTATRYVAPEGVINSANGALDDAALLQYAETIRNPAPMYMCSNLETLVIRNSIGSVSDLFSGSIPVKLKNIFIITHGSDIYDLRIFEGISNVSIFIDADTKELGLWNSTMPGWNNGNNVYSSDKWNFIEFVSDEGELLEKMPVRISEVIRLPIIYDVRDRSGTRTFTGWDIDGDGEPDFVPATTDVPLTARAVMDVVENIYTSTFDWSDDYRICKINITCSTDHTYDDRITVIPVMTVQEEPTCTEMGKTLYTVDRTYGGHNYKDTRVVSDIPALGHDYVPSYSWSADGSECTVTIVCSHDAEHHMSAPGTVTSKVKTAPTFFEMGITEYTVSVTIEGIAYSDTKEIADIPYTPNEEGGNKTYEASIANDAAVDVTDLFTAAKENNGSVEIRANTSSGELTIAFDREAVGSIGENTVTITASVSTESTSVDDAELIIEVTLAGAVFDSGSAKVSIPFDKSVPKGKVAKVYYINGGQRADMDATFTDGVATFTTNHFSTYAIVFENLPSDDPNGDPNEDKPSKDNGSGNGSGFPIVFVVIGAVAVLGIAGAVLFMIKRH